MVKHFNIIMAGVISGIVALFTSWLGVSGTVIGSVLSSFLYQLLSTYYEEKTKNINISKVNNRNRRNRSSPDSKKIVNNKDSSVLTHKIAFIFPVLVILIVESLFCLAAVSSSIYQVFSLLEAVTDQNLFRVMGISLVIVSIYPFLKPNIIKRINGFILLVVGCLLFLRGIIDIHPILTQIYYFGLYRIDLHIGVVICIVLLIVIFSVLIPSKSTADIMSKDRKGDKNWGAKKINTNFNNDSNNYVNFDDKFNRDNSFNNRSIKSKYVDDLDIIPNTNQNIQNNYSVHDYGISDNNSVQDNYIEDSSFIPNNRHDKIYVDDYGEPIPIYEEDYIYVSDPNNPNRTVKKKILKKVSKDINPPKHR